MVRVFGVRKNLKVLSKRRHVVNVDTLIDFDDFFIEFITLGGFFGVGFFNSTPEHVASLLLIHKIAKGCIIRIKACHFLQLRVRYFDHGYIFPLFRMKNHS